MKSYSYVTLRYVHDMTTREFVNVGVVVFSPDAKFVGAKVCSKSHRVKSMFPDVSMDHLATLLSGVQAKVEILRTNISSDSRPKSAGQIETLVTSILPRDESSLQWGDVGGGLASDPRMAMEGLFQRLVLKHERAPKVQRVVITVPVYIHGTHRLEDAPFQAPTISSMLRNMDPHVSRDRVSFDGGITVTRTAYQSTQRARRNGDVVSG
jgi:hypothetical protein